LRERRALLLVGLFAASAIVLGLLAMLVGQGGPLAADLAIERWLQQLGSPELTWLMLAVSWLGYAPQSVAVTLVLAAAVAGLTGRWRDGLWQVGTQIAMPLTSVIKVMIHRPRPTEDLVRVYSTIQEYGFPSGHVVFFTTLFGFAFFLIYVHLPRVPGRAFLLALLATPILLIGISRVYLGYHWPSDALGGYALATALLVPYCWLYARIEAAAPDRARRRAPSAG
jgi:undecaprenyl-diphosphatase